MRLDMRPNDSRLTAGCFHFINNVDKIAILM